MVNPARFGRSHLQFQSKSRRRTIISAFRRDREIAPLFNLSSDIRQKEFLCRKRPEFPPDVTGSVRGIKADFPICIKKLFSDIHFPYF